MGETIRVGRKEMTAAEVLAEIEDGNRVLIEVEVLGRRMRMAIRRDSETFYCDTPIKLLTFDSPEDLAACLVRYRLAKTDHHTDSSTDSLDPDED